MDIQEPNDRKPTEFGAVIRGALEKLGQTQSWIAHEGGVSHTCVSKWIYNPKGQIKDDNVEMLSKLLDVSKAKLIAARARVSDERKTNPTRRPTLTRGDAVGASNGSPANNTVIRTLLPTLSSEQRAKVLDLIVERVMLPPSEERQVVEYIVKLILPDGG